MANICFRCDGNGKLCNVCGESERACKCDEGFDPYECPDCNGKGE